MPIRFIEVGPRDGLQNEPEPISIDAKLRFIERLAAAGVTEIEATSFVSPKWVPQLADAPELWSLLPKGPLYSAFIPNLKGLERAETLEVNRIALFTAVSESFTRANVNMTVDETMAQVAAATAQFRSTSDPQKWVRVYVSTVFECPFEGRTPVASLLSLVERILNLEIDEISLGDTIGVASPSEVQDVAKNLIKSFGEDIREKIAWHFHDTWGTGLANASEAFDLGFRQFDASAGGLGGCPYAPGAGGNLASEDLIYLLERSGLKTGVNLEKLAQASEEILKILGKRPTARAQVAALARCAAGSSPT